MDVCNAYAVPVMSSTSFRIVQSVHLLLAASGFFLVAYVLLFVLPKTIMHSNLRLLSYLYFINLLICDIVSFFAQGHTVWTSLTFSDPCSAFLPLEIYRIVHPFLAFSIFVQTWLQTSLWIERLVASYRLNNYETCGLTLGIFLVILTALATAGELLYVFNFFDSSLFSLEVSYFFFPDSLAHRLNLTLMVSVAFCTLGIFASSFLYFYNRRKRNEIGAHLSHRYQTIENLRATQFVLSFSFVTTILFTISGVYILFVRLMRKSLFDNIAAFSTARSTGFSMPILSVLLPVAAIVVSKRQKRSKEVYITRKTSEAEAYSKILQKQWDRMSHMRDL